MGNFNCLLRDAKFITIVIKKSIFALSQSLKRINIKIIQLHLPNLASTLSEAIEHLQAFYLLLIILYQ